MSLHLEFEPHSWYMGFAIQKDNIGKNHNDTLLTIWRAYIDNGNTYRIDEIAAPTLEELKLEIRDYHLAKHDGYGERIAARRLKFLRDELRQERISYAALAELQYLSDYINPSDIELLEAAGVPEAT